jgi:L-cysteine S-thiosulfotransferase
MATFEKHRLVARLGWIPVFAGMTLVACTTQPAVEGAITTPFAPSADVASGREVFVSREGGHCVLCHEAPGVEAFGNVGPPLAGVGSRLTVPQLRLRVADITKVSPQATMPTFHRADSMTRVASQYEGRTVLTGQQVEDVVAWLATLR